ncbi:efflux RND transporter periplasmic adaptor subunit [Mucilaginibacter limnophilus]|uniref:Efflux RND transporter periplasmic adaptor subunit n=1 Tax=Mucilaginibacter limnophilus TaxID=1932778 RepID=A0A437MUJ9_9SPHI|nr:efflux RND transporter periplasmic adaptor subunit [Mucilaginibacter limnophilus]RVU01331.1 efflux RND transporter periplasmic adaptor subunit [Mucilaginibacter limnophilus]
MKIRYIIYLLLAILVAYLIYNKFFGGDDKIKPDDKGGKRGGPVPVNILLVRDTALSTTIDITGTISANEQVNLVSQASGTITGIYFNEGSRVKKGQLLVKVYSQDLQASLAQNEYQVALAKQNEYRNRVLYEKEAVSKQEYETSLASLNSLKAQSAAIRAQITRTEIRAPFSGTVGLRNVSPGGYLSPSSPVATLVNIDPAKITFSVPEKYLSLIKDGSKVNFIIESSRKTFTATVYAIEPSIDVNSRTITVRARAANPDGLLTAGSFAKISLALEEIPRTIMVPTQSVIPDIKNNNVFVLDSGMAMQRQVKIGLRTDKQIEIVEGLKEGDSVITSGIIQLRPRVPVKVQKVVRQ